MAEASYLGAKITLISVAGVRYEGYLLHVEPEKKQIMLQSGENY